MPRLERLGLDERTLSVLGSLPVPITLAESLLSRDSEQLALECGVSLQAVSKLRYLVALRCQAQPIVPDRRRQETRYDGHDRNTQEAGAASGFPAAGGATRGGSAAGSTPMSFATADELYQQAKEVGGFVTTGSDSLDSLLCRGLMLHHVVEVVGRSSVGKTQLCLTAAVAAASHGIGVLYLDTANGCSVRRMQQIARSRYADADGDMTARQMDSLLDRLRVVRAFDISTVISSLVAYMDGVTSGTGPEGVFYSSCRLVILDSVTAVVSPLLGGVKNPAGHGLMATLGHLLNRTASQCSACVLVANSTVASRAGGGTEETRAEGQEPRAALGMTWEGVPAIRLLLAEAEAEVGGIGAAGSGRNVGANGCVTRLATLLKHPAQACGSSASFSIGDGGITDVHEDDQSGA